MERYDSTNDSMHADAALRGAPARRTEGASGTDLAATFGGRRPDTEMADAKPLNSGMMR